MGTLRTIRSGASFVTRDPETGADVTLYGGQEIELDDDVAQAHADKLEPLPAKDVQASAPTGAA